MKKKANTRTHTQVIPQRKLENKTEQHQQQQKRKKLIRLKNVILRTV